MNGWEIRSVQGQVDGRKGRWVDGWMKKKIDERKDGSLSDEGLGSR